MFHWGLGWGFFVAGPVVVTIVEDICVVDVEITVDYADVVIAVAGGDTINLKNS